MRFLLPYCLCLTLLLAPAAFAQQPAAPRVASGGAGFGPARLPPGLPGTPANDGAVGSPEWEQHIQQQNTQLDVIGRRLLHDEQTDSAGHYRADAGEAWPTD